MYNLDCDVATCGVGCYTCANHSLAIDMSSGDVIGGATFVTIVLVMFVVVLVVVLIASSILLLLLVLYLVLVLMIF